MVQCMQLDANNRSLPCTESHGVLGDLEICDSRDSGFSSQHSQRVVSRPGDPVARPTLHGTSPMSAAAASTAMNLDGGGASDRKRRRPTLAAAATASEPSPSAPAESAGAGAAAAASDTSVFVLPVTAGIQDAGTVTRGRRGGPANGVVAASELPPPTKRTRGQQQQSGPPPAAVDDVVEKAVGKGRGGGGRAAAPQRAVVPASEELPTSAAPGGGDAIPARSTDGSGVGPFNTWAGIVGLAAPPSASTQLPAMASTAAAALGSSSGGGGSSKEELRGAPTPMTGVTGQPAAEPVLVAAPVPFAAATDAAAAAAPVSSLTNLMCPESATVVDFGGAATDISPPASTYTDMVAQFDLPYPAEPRPGSTSHAAVTAVVVPADVVTAAASDDVTDLDLAASTAIAPPGQHGFLAAEAAFPYASGSIVRWLTGGAPAVPLSPPAVEMTVGPADASPSVPPAEGGAADEAGPPPVQRGRGRGRGKARGRGRGRVGRGAAAAAGAARAASESSPSSSSPSRSDDDAGGGEASGELIARDGGGGIGLEQLSAGGGAAAVNDEPPPAAAPGGGATAHELAPPITAAATSAVQASAKATQSVVIPAIPRRQPPGSRAPALTKPVALAGAMRGAPANGEAAGSGEAPDAPATLTPLVARTAVGGKVDALALRVASAPATRPSLIGASDIPSTGGAGRLQEQGLARRSQPQVLPPLQPLESRFAPLSRPSAAATAPSSAAMATQASSPHPGRSHAPANSGNTSARSGAYGADMRSDSGGWTGGSLSPSPFIGGSATVASGSAGSAGGSSPFQQLGGRGGGGGGSSGGNSPASAPISSPIAGGGVVAEAELTAWADALTLKLDSLVQQVFAITGLNLHTSMTLPLQQTTATVSSLPSSSPLASAASSSSSSSSSSSAHHMAESCAPLGRGLSRVFSVLRSPHYCDAASGQVWPEDPTAAAAAAWAAAPLGAWVRLGPGPAAPSAQKTLAWYGVDTDVWSHAPAGVRPTRAPGAASRMVPALTAGAATSRTVPALTAGAAGGVPAVAGAAVSGTQISAGTRHAYVAGGAAAAAAAPLRATGASAGLPYLNPYAADLGMRLEQPEGGGEQAPLHLRVNSDEHPSQHPLLPQRRQEQQQQLEQHQYQWPQQLSPFTVHNAAATVDLTYAEYPVGAAPHPVEGGRASEFADSDLLQYAASVAAGAPAVDDHYARHQGRGEGAVAYQYDYEEIQQQLPQSGQHSPYQHEHEQHYIQPQPQQRHQHQEEHQQHHQQRKPQPSTEPLLPPQRHEDRQADRSGGWQGGAPPVRDGGDRGRGGALGEAAARRGSGGGFQRGEGDTRRTDGSSARYGDPRPQQSQGRDGDRAAGSSGTGSGAEGQWQHPNHHHQQQPLSQSSYGSNGREDFHSPTVGRGVPDHRGDRDGFGGGGSHIGGAGRSASGGMPAERRGR